jgi:hypothetical protein
VSNSAPKKDRRRARISVFFISCSYGDECSLCQMLPRNAPGVRTHSAQKRKLESRNSSPRVLLLFGHSDDIFVILPFRNPSCELMRQSLPPELRNSRARQAMHLFTDSIAALREAVCRPSERLSGIVGGKDPQIIMMGSLRTRSMTSSLNCRRFYLFRGTSSKIDRENDKELHAW